MSYLDNNGLAHLWGKIKSLVNTKADKSTALEYRGVIDDANNATSNGIYHFNGSTPNAPTTSPCECFVMAFGERYIQIVARDSSTSDSYLYKRTHYNGAWGSWYRYTGTKL